MKTQYKIKDTKDIFALFAQQNEYYFDSSICVATGWEYDAFITVNPVQSPALLYSLYDIVIRPDNLENGTMEGFTEKWQIYPYSRGTKKIGTDTLQVNEMTDNFLRNVFYDLRLFFENTSFVIDNKFSKFNGFEIYGDLLAGSASYKVDAKGQISEEYQHQLELNYFRNY